MEPPYNGHFGDNINSGAIVHYREVVRFKRFYNVQFIQESKVWDQSFVLYKEVFNTLSFIQRVRYNRFHCNPPIQDMLAMGEV